MNKSLIPKKKWLGIYAGQPNMYQVRCDEPMKKSKERTGSWKCMGDCRRCICGITKPIGYRDEWHNSIDSAKGKKDISDLFIF